MPLNLASPGIIVREVDLTIGRVDPVSGSIGALAAPFARGPVGLPQLIESEDDLFSTYGKPYNTDKQYESWMVASSYLAYGGTMQVVRADDTGLKNASDNATPALKIKSDEHYNQLGYDDNTIASTVIAAQNPGSWANGIRVAVCDGKADQVLVGLSTAAVTAFNTAISNRSGIIVGSASTIGISTASVTVGQEVLSDVAGVVPALTTITSIGVGIVTVSNASLQSVDVTTTFDFGSRTTTTAGLKVGAAVTQTMVGKSIVHVSAGTTSQADGYLKGVVTDIGVGEASVKVIEHVSAAGTVYTVDYQQAGTYSFNNTGSVGLTTVGYAVTASYGTAAYTSQKDWFEQQTVGLSTGLDALEWDQLADRPGTSAYAASRGGRFDEVHVVVFDDKGTITGNAGTILEKHLNLSKAKDGEYSAGSPSYWRKYLKNNSKYIYGGGSPNATQTDALGNAVGLTTSAYSTTATNTLDADSGWDQDSKNVNFGVVGAATFELNGGLDYGGGTDINVAGSLDCGVDDIVSGLNIFANKEQYEVDFILQGSANFTKEQAQAIANKAVAVAEARKDAVAFISPYRQAFITDTTAGTATVQDDDTITSNVVSFYAPITSTTYGVFDSGYKYMFDRFNNTFRYVPLNGDIAGTCARTDQTDFPWFSPAGTNRGAILNVVKLAYNPGKVQRDTLYSNRINPVILSPGAGVILFGDKTGYGKASAFDRINVRRLFIYLEDAISAAAKDQLFEFNDEITRTNFVNIVEPFLRDVQSKRGIYDYVVICDETNNTAAVIDNNEFIADIYIKPARSINFIGLTFIATRTGVAFEEVIGNV